LVLDAMIFPATLADVPTRQQCLLIRRREERVSDDESREPEPFTIYQDVW